jgi:uncharacterized membrane protein
MDNNDFGLISVSFVGYIGVPLGSGTQLILLWMGLVAVGVLEAHGLRPKQHEVVIQYQVARMTHSLTITIFILNTTIW